MVFHGGRSVGRLPQLTLQRLANRRTALSSYGVERVPAVYNVSQLQYHSEPVFKYRLSTPILARTYAQTAVSRPKAHIGRTTTAARKAPTTSVTKAAKKPAPKKTTPKAVPKAKSTVKPRIKPKPKPAKKKKAKAKPKPKPKPKPKKVLTEAQKLALKKRQLKATALQPPRETDGNTWKVFLSEKLRAADVLRGNFGRLAKEASAEFKQLTPERLEHYNHIANQNKAANATAYRQWIESHTPNVIYEANVARRHLRKLGENARSLNDDRQVKRLRSPWLYFHQQRMQSGDFKGLKIGEGSKLMSREWDALPAAEKKPFEDLAAQDSARYRQEIKTVLNKNVRARKQ